MTGATWHRVDAWNGNDKARKETLLLSHVRHLSIALLILGLVSELLFNLREYLKMLFRPASLSYLQPMLGQNKMKRQEGTCLERAGRRQPDDVRSRSQFFFKTVQPVTVNPNLWFTLYARSSSLGHVPTCLGCVASSRHLLSLFSPVHPGAWESVRRKALKSPWVQVHGSTLQRALPCMGTICNLYTCTKYRLHCTCDMYTQLSPDFIPSAPHCAE